MNEDTTNTLVEVEKRFLAYLFHDKKYIVHAMGKIQKEHLPEYGVVYSLLISYFKKFKDVITDNMVDLQFKKKNVSQELVVKYKVLISEIRMETEFNDGEFASLMEELIEQYQRKVCLDIASEIINNNPQHCNSKEFDFLKNNLKKSIFKIDNIGQDIRKEGSVTNSAKSRLERYKRIKEHPEELNFTTSGFKHIDEVMGGYRPGELIYVIGRKGDGKSVFLLNTAFGMWKAGKNVIIFSLEISKEDYERRFDALAAGVPSKGLKMGQLTPQEEKTYEEYLIKQEKGLTLDGEKCGVLYIVDHAPGMTAAFMESKIEEVEQVMGIKFDVAISDYSGIMRDNSGASEKRHIYGNIALDLKTLAREKEMIVISAAQKNRASVKDGKNGVALVGTEAVAESDSVSDHLDAGFDIMSLGEDYGKIESFKTRDSEPICFTFRKRYEMFKILEVEIGSSSDVWNAIK